MWTTALLLIGIWVNKITVYSHPQCLDFTFPFTTKTPSYICTEYETFGCCDSRADVNIFGDFLRVFYKLQPLERARCTKYLKALLCQKCSPYAAHIYESENLPQARTFPGLCPTYCNTLLSSGCSAVMKPFINDARVLSLIEQKNYAAVCNAVTTSDPDYCYPDLKQNPDLSQNLGRVEYYQANSACIAICLEEIDSGRSSPVSMKHAKDGTNRMFVVEQLGMVWVYLSDNSRLDVPFLDLKQAVAVNKRRYDERGMLDIEFHPKYGTNGLFYLYYTIVRRSRTYVRISEMNVMDTDMNRADISSERILLEILQPARNHNGGQLLFKHGEVGNYLYIFSGDGGASGDPFGRHGNGQNSHRHKMRKKDGNEIGRESNYRYIHRFFKIIICRS